MKPIFATTLAAALLMSSQVKAGPGDYYECGDMLSVEGTSSNVEGSDDFKKYNGHPPADLAKLRAISTWQGIIAEQCPHDSAIWRRAKEKSVECEGSAGHEHCTATAIPGRKILSWLTE
jgi:hypothetical protein